MSTATTDPAFVTQTALSATGFLNSLGVNTHLSFDTSTYANVAKVATALDYLGIDHVRDSLYTSTLAISSFDTLAADGIKFDFDPALRADHTVSVSGFVNQLASYEHEFPGSISAIEGANEVNNFPINIGGT